MILHDSQAFDHNSRRNLKKLTQILKLRHPIRNRTRTYRQCPETHGGVHDHTVLIAILVQCNR